MRVLFAAVLLVSPAVASAAHPLTTLLKSLPEVDSVTERPGDSVVQVIIHLRDCHYVDFESFTANLRDSDPDISDGNLERAYRDHLRLVQAVQAEQRRRLRNGPCCSCWEAVTTCQTTLHASSAMRPG